jgi:hypothetical protein
MLLILCIFTNCNNINQEMAKVPTNKNELKWLLTGLPADLSRENGIAQFYGFQFEAVGGCVVSKSLRDSINLINKKANDSLTEKFGKYWRRDFESCIEFVERKTNR